MPRDFSSFDSWLLHGEDFILASSGYLEILEFFIKQGRKFIKTRNRSGPRQDPYGMPTSISFKFESQR